MFNEVIGQKLQRRKHAGSSLKPEKFSDPPVEALIVVRALSPAFLTGIRFDHRMKNGAAVAQVVERSPEKAGVGGSTPSRGTIKSTTYKTPEPKTCSNLFHNSNPGPAEVCLSHQSVEDSARGFASFLKVHFAQEIDRDPRTFKKIVLRLVRRGLPPRRGRPNDPRLDAAALMVAQGKSVKDVLRTQVQDFEKMDTYSRYLAEKGLRTAIARRRWRGRRQKTNRRGDHTLAASTLNRA